MKKFKLQNDNGSPYTCEDFKLKVAYKLVKLHLVCGKEVIKQTGITLSGSEVMKLLLLPSFWP